MRRFEQMMSSQESVQGDLESSGVSDAKEWRDALDLGTPLEGEDEVESINRNFDKLFSFIEGGGEQVSDSEKVEVFKETEDSIKKLEILRTLSMRDAATCLRDYSDNPAQYNYLSKRLDFYQKLFQGKAIRKYSAEEYNSRTGRYVEVEKEEPISADNVTSESVRLGVLRDSLFASMIGTPELAVYKIADRNLTEKEGNRGHMPELKGYHSYIDEDGIGYAYPLLHDIYQKARKEVDSKYSEREGWDEDRLEHKAVLRAADWLEEAMEYNDPHRGPESPYVSSVEESIAWARLGDERVKAQLRGMRQKIMSADLHNIDRFIGKSGTNKYDSERKKLYGQLKFITESSDEEAKQTLLDKENGFAVRQQETYFENESRRIEAKFNKARKEITELSLPEEESRLQLRSLEDEHHVAMRKLTDDVNAQKEYYEGRTLEQLKKDLEERQEVVTERYERRKNLAQKALDLHWMEGVAKDEHDDDSIYNPVDWINYAPFGTIKRAHKMLSNGSDSEAIIKYALADIIVGKRGMNRADLKTVSELYDAASAGDWDERRRVESIMQVANIISSAGYEVEIDNLSQMAEQRYSGLTEALKEYPLDEVREFMDKEIDLNSVVTVKQVTQKFGHTLDNNTVAEMAKNNINGLEDVMAVFSLADVQALLGEEVNLPTAVAVLDNSKRFGHNLSIDQIAAIVKGVQDIDDFKSALHKLPLEEVESLYSKSISYKNFSIVQDAMQSNAVGGFGLVLAESARLDAGHIRDKKVDFDLILTMAEKLSTQNEYDSLKSALENFSLEEVELLLESSVRLNNAVDVKTALTASGVSMELPDLMQVIQLAGDWNLGSNVTQAIETFSLEGLRNIVAKKCRIDKAISIRSQIHENGGNISVDLKEAMKRGGIETVIAIAKAGSVEVAAKTIEAGFTLEEIAKFPFLISSLVTKR